MARNDIWVLAIWTTAHSLAWLFANCYNPPQ